MTEASGLHSITLAELSEYKKYIMGIISRLHNEKSLSLKERITSEGKTAVVLEFRAPEWFRELSEDIHEIAFNNLQRIHIFHVNDNEREGNKYSK